MKRCLLDSSFVIDLLNEVAASRRGSACAWVARNAGADLWISPITYAEVLEGADFKRTAAITTFAIEIYLSKLLSKMTT